MADVKNRSPSPNQEPESSENRIKASLSAGKNVRVSEDRLHFFAEINGCPIVETDRLGERISVSELFYVSGDLDLSVGNIDFDGIVEIGGDVEDGFKIKATKKQRINSETPGRTA